MSAHRIEELDFLKCVMIVLMVAFHLVYIGDSFPAAKEFVYTFHMPVFLMISGYLMNVQKATSAFLRNILFFIIPYVIMESGYTFMASLLPIREHIDNLTISVFFDKLFLHPLGPYWFLHTLIICGLTYFASFRIPVIERTIHNKTPLSVLTTLGRIIAMGILLFLLSQAGFLSFTMAFYFLIGVTLRNTETDFISFFHPSWLSLPALLLFPLLHKNIPFGDLLTVYLMISFLLALFPHISYRYRRLLLFLGRNTLPIYLFSPIFTILCKSLVVPLSFDPTKILFLVSSLIACISGSLAIAFAMDLCRVSPFFFGSEKILKK